MGLILNSIQGHLTILCLKKEAVGLEVKEIIHCSKLSSYAVSRAPTKPSLRKLQKKKKISGLILARLDQIWVPKIFFILDVRHSRKLSLYPISWKTYPNSRKWRKYSFWAWFRPIGPKFGPPFFFLICLPHTRYWSAIIMYNIWKKLWSNLRKI